MRTLNKRKAVSPVLATLLMIAVAVALAVVIFAWSQGFLSSTSSAVGTEQGAQNIAAQSQIAIENVIPDPDNNQVTIIIRNVGSVTVTLGSIQIQGLPANTGINETVSLLVPTDTTQTLTAVNGSSIEVIHVYDSTGTDLLNNAVGDALTIQKGRSVTLTVTLSKTTDRTADVLVSGDFITVKATTRVGSFAQYSVTTP